MKTRKVTVGLLLVAMLAPAVVGCGRNNEDNNTTNNNIIVKILRVLCVPFFEKTREEVRIESNIPCAVRFDLAMETRACVRRSISWTRMGKRFR